MTVAPKQRLLLFEYLLLARQIVNDKPNAVVYAGGLILAYGHRGHSNGLQDRTANCDQQPYQTIHHRLLTPAPCNENLQLTHCYLTYEQIVDRPKPAVALQIRDGTDDLLCPCKGDATLHKEHFQVLARV
jgi:hypothetical protein